MFLIKNFQNIKSHANTDKLIWSMTESFIFKQQKRKSKSVSYHFRNKNLTRSL